MHRIFHQRALHPGECELEVAHALLGDLGDAVHGVDALFGVALTVQHRLLDADQLVPGVLHPIQRLEDLADRRRLDPLREQALERAERGLVLGRGGQDLAVHLDRALHVAEPHLLQLPGAELQVQHLVRAAGDLGLARHDLGELGPALGRFVQTIERLQRLEVRRVELVHDAIARDRALDAAICTSHSLARRSARSTACSGLSSRSRAISVS